MADKFLWGVATSAYQIEGQAETDMSQWEKRIALKSNENLHISPNHWEFWKEDFSLLPQLNINAYRFSMEWARLMPEYNTWNIRAFDQYDRMIDFLLEKKIQPFLTLLHFTHPTWFHKKTPWTSDSSVEAFMTYTEKIAAFVGDRINYFITINEPLVWLLAAYADAKFPPGFKDFNKMTTALYNMLSAHKKAYDIIKSKIANAQIGIAKNFIIFSAGKKLSPLDHGVTYKLDEFYNKMIPNAFKKNKLEFKFPGVINIQKDIQLNDSIDFWGLNYYYRMHASYSGNSEQPFKFYFKQKTSEGLSELGWENYSKGLLKVLRMLNKFKKPIIISENGVAETNDKKRIDYLKNHLSVVKQAIENKINIKGYFYWSFLDNYEWLEGIKARFGLVEIDYENNLKRKIRPSAKFYANYIKNESY